MATSAYLFTSESVSEGHPDKVCDRISDEIVDLMFQRTIEEGGDPFGVRVAAETLATTNKVVIAGETRGPQSVSAGEIEALARSAIKDIGYEQDGFHHETVDIDVLLHGQSSDIAQGVDGEGNHEEGAGDQGIMFGYACRETPSLMPAPIHYSHLILKRLAELRHDGTESWLGPDSKSQVTVAYENGVPVRAASIVVSTQHLDASMNSQEIQQRIAPYVTEVLPPNWVDAQTVWHVNPTGNFVIGGPDGDCGLTGRKIIVDTYGGAAPHGGGAFSGKDPTKVDRSAAYASRYLAKNVVAAELAERCTLQLSYAIGVAEPLSLFVNCHGTEKVSERSIENAILKSMDLRPTGIRERLELNRPIYARTAAYGHFGRDPDDDGGFTWERLNLIDELKSNI